MVKKETNKQKISVPEEETARKREQTKILFGELFCGLFSLYLFFHFFFLPEEAMCWIDILAR